MSIDEIKPGNNSEPISYSEKYAQLLELLTQHAVGQSLHMKPRFLEMAQEECDAMEKHWKELDDRHDAERSELLLILPWLRDAIQRHATFYAHHMRRVLDRMLSLPDAELIPGQLEWMLECSRECDSLEETYCIPPPLETLPQPLPPPPRPEKDAA